MSASCQLTYFFLLLDAGILLEILLRWENSFHSLIFLLDDKRCPFSVGGDELGTPCKFHHMYPTFYKAERKPKPSLQMTRLSFRGEKPLESCC